MHAQFIFQFHSAPKIQSAFAHACTMFIVRSACNHSLYGYKQDPQYHFLLFDDRFAFYAVSHKMVWKNLIFINRTRLIVGPGIGNKLFIHINLFDRLPIINVRNLLCTRHTGIQNSFSVCRFTDPNKFPKISICKFSQKNIAHFVNSIIVGHDDPAFILLFDESRKHQQFSDLGRFYMLFPVYRSQHYHFLFCRAHLQ